MKTTLLFIACILLSLSVIGQQDKKNTALQLQILSKHYLAFIRQCWSGKNKYTPLRVSFWIQTYSQRQNWYQSGHMEIICSYGHTI